MNIFDKVCIQCWTGIQRTFFDKLDTGWNICSSNVNSHINRALPRKAGIRPNVSIMIKRYQSKTLNG